MRKHHKRIFSFLLAFVMVIGLMPGTAHAAERPSAAPLNKETIEVEVYVGRQQTVSLAGAVVPDASGVAGIADVTCSTQFMAAIGNSNTFSEGFEPLVNSLYTFDRQENGTWLIWAEVGGTKLYVDPHAGAGNGGRPSRDYQTFITLEDSIGGTVKLHEPNGGFLHFWDNDDSKLYWDQCTADGGHTGHNLLIYRQALENETANSEVPGFVKVSGVSEIESGGQYLIVGKANSGGYYALRPSLSTASKYQHICKVAGPVTELTITGLAVGSGVITTGSYTLNVRVVDTSDVRITLDYNYPGAPENGTLRVAAGDPIGELPVPMRPGYTFFGWNLGSTKITSSYVVTGPVTLTAEWTTVPTKEKPANGTTTGQPFHVTDANGSAYCYRIPGIVTLSDGTVVAMADQRWNTYIDCGGLDTILSVSHDNGKTWEYTYANYLGDNGDVYNQWSTTFIDPAIATDGETVYMIADLFPAGVSTWAAGYASQAGSGGFNADGYLMLRDLVGDTYRIADNNVKSAYIAMATSRSYDFYLFPEEDGSYTIRRVADDSVVDGYSVDAMLHVTSADGSVNTHLFQADSPYQVYPTNYLYLTTSADGLNWSAPQLIRAKTASESAFLIGPGSGTYDAERGNMIFTAYCYSGSAGSQRSCLLWAGKDGVWHRSEPATTDVWSSEASAVVLENGTVRVFYRSGSTTLCYTDYLWVNGEYVRDENNTSISTAAVKNSGNGCMLTAVLYPEKINGKEMIFVATPATSNSRSNGHLYAFYVNKDGSMELAVDYDITPYASEYYAYSCLTVLTQGEEAGDLALFWEDSWTSSPASCTIKYDVLPIKEVLADLREVVRKDVTLTVGQQVSFQDDEGYYVGADTSDLDPDVASVEVTGTVTRTVTGADEAVSAIESGKQYIIVNTRAGKPMTNDPAASAAAAGAGSGLSLAGVKENVPENAIWTIEAAGNGYRIIDANGKYLSVTSNGASLKDTESIVSIGRNGSTWTISQNGAYLNDFGGGGTCAAGWQHSTAPTDAGSQWHIYTLEEIPVEGTSVITFTGVGVGETQVQIGYYLYCITVTDAFHEHVFEAVVTAPTCTEGGYTTYTCECGESYIADETEALGHDWKGTSCTRCDATRENPFTDVPEGSFYIDPVLWAVEKGITTGATATTFNPNGNCQRAQVVTFLWRAAGSPEPTKTENPFTDVPADAFYYKAVLWAVEKGVTNGLTADTFGPFALCNRSQVVTFLWRAMGSPASDAEVSFTDVQSGQFYSTAVAWAVENNITNGISATEFGVGGICNRAQVVTFLYRTYVK